MDMLPCWKEGRVDDPFEVKENKEEDTPVAEANAPVPDVPPHIGE